MRRSVSFITGLLVIACAACGSNNDPQLVGDDDMAGDGGMPTDMSVADMGSTNGGMVDLGIPDLGECDPERADPPDPFFFDANCDGIDGDASASVFVADYGDDQNPGTQALPKRTIQAAIETAADEQKPWVLLADGLHEGGFRLADGVGIAGGYGFGWERDGSFRTTIRGGNPAIHGVDISSATLLIGFEVEPAERVDPGETVVTVLLEQSPGVTLRRLRIEGGVGGDGAKGAEGLDGDPGPNGDPGDDGREDSGFIGCDEDGKPNVGDGATNSCAEANGGDGGSPGKENDSGQKGADSPGGAIGGEPGPESQPGGRGQDGDRGANGAPGPGGTADGNFDGWQWEGEDGGPGEPGEPGVGGGGGGGGGGGSNMCDSWGGAGGGGGAGGCGGQEGGGGTHGGASVALFLIESDVSIVECSIIGGAGGAGGSGGDGGIGGRGGLGADGGRREDDSGKGGRGGDGGVGGVGGQGGGGAGGPAHAVYSTAELTEQPVNTEISEGTGGPGGLAASAEGKGAIGAAGGLVVAD